MQRCITLCGYNRRNVQTAKNIAEYEHGRRPHIKKRLMCVQRGNFTIIKWQKN